MNTSRKTTRILGDMKINVKIKLSALWVTLMLFYIYADILGFYSPGVIEQVVSGEIGGFQISDGVLFIMAIWMAVPSLMVFLSLALKVNVNRWVNIFAAIISLIALAATILAGEFSARYAFQALAEAVLIVVILWQAWRWPEEQNVGVTP